MGRVQLKVFDSSHGEIDGFDEDGSEEPVSIRLPASYFASQRLSKARRSVTVQLSDVAEALADAISSRRAWIDDFEDDEITLSADLYEALIAFDRLRRPSA